MKRQFLLFVLMMIGLQLAAKPMRACSQDFPASINRDQTEEADLVLIGTVTGSSSGDVYTANYTIQVEWYLKGEGPDALLITGFGYEMGDCRNRIAVGERWVFFVDGDSKTDTVLQASYTFAYDAVTTPDPDTLKSITSIIGKAPVRPYRTPFWTMLRYWTYSPVFKLAVFTGVPLVIIASGWVINRLRNRHKSKKKNE